jgi:hypothetical protein
MFSNLFWTMVCVPILGVMFLIEWIWNGIVMGAAMITLILNLLVETFRGKRK